MAYWTDLNNMIKINDNIPNTEMIHNIHKKKRDKGFPISLILASVLAVAMDNLLSNRNISGLCSNSSANSIMPKK